jgi:putative ABC transport system substrate-binding protein
MTAFIGRREFTTLLGGAAAAWPLVARGQQAERVRRIGVLHFQAADDPEQQARLAAFRLGLQQLGWTDGRNVRIDFRWSAGNAADTRRFVAELVALAPDVILTSGAAAVAPLLQATRSVPIVFVLVADPVGAGFVDSMARPGGNATGFTALEYSFGGKWLQLLKEVAPGVTRAAVIRDPTDSAGMGLFGAIQSAAASVGVELSPVNVRDASEMERAIAAFARASNCGLILTPNSLAFVHRNLSSHLRPGTSCRRSISTGFSSLPAGWLPTGLITSTSTDARPVTSTVSSKARNHPTFRYRRRPSMRR